MSQHLRGNPEPVPEGWQWVSGDKELLDPRKEPVKYRELRRVQQRCLDNDVGHVAACLNLAE